MKADNYIIHTDDGEYRLSKMTREQMMRYIMGDIDGCVARVYQQHDVETCEVNTSQPAVDSGPRG